MGYKKENKIRKLQQYREQTMKSLHHMEELRKTPGKNLSKQQRLKLEKKIIDQTQIICTTLAMSTNEKLDHLDTCSIEYLIVEEACQSVELNNLIPFEHNPHKVILVGDQQQLPATTFSENAERTKYSRSMFERFLECGIDRVMLEVQYRMNPGIREFPSNQFYEKRLQDDDTITKRVNDPKYFDCSLGAIQKGLNSLMFYDIAYSREDASENSKTNMEEIKFIENLIKSFIHYVAKRNFDEQMK